MNSLILLSKVLSTFSILRFDKNCSCEVSNIFHHLRNPLTRNANALNVHGTTINRRTLFALLYCRLQNALGCIHEGGKACEMDGKVRKQTHKVWSNITPRKRILQNVDGFVHGILSMCSFHVIVVDTILLKFHLDSIKFYCDFTASNKNTKLSSWSFFNLKKHHQK